MEHPPLPWIGGDGGKGTGQDFRGGAVVFSQADGPQLGQILPQAVEAPALGAPEPVDGLVWIADDKEAFSPLAPLAHQLVL